MSLWLSIPLVVALGFAVPLLYWWMRRPKDLPTPPLEVLDWSDTAREQSLARIYEHVRNDARTAIDWYIRARKPKKFLSRTTRFVAMAAVAVAGILPLINEVVAGVNISGVWVSIAVAVAGAAVGFDKFYDSSTGWIRYMTTEQQLRNALETFEMEWESQRAAWAGSPPNADALTSMLNRARAFANEVNSIVRDETYLWVEQFKSSMKDIEAMVQAREEARREGVVNIVLTNGDDVDGEWVVTDETGEETRARGKRSALKLPVGTRILLVRGNLRGRDKPGMDQKGVIVLADKVTDAEFTLS